MKESSINQNQFSRVKVLVVDGYARQSLSMCRALKNLNVHVTVTCYSKLDVSYVSRFPDIKLLYPCDSEDVKTQEKYVCNEIRTGKYDVVIPMNDRSATYLSKNKEELKKYAKIAVNDWSKFKLVIDKIHTMRICMENNIPAPITILTDDPVKEIDNGIIGYPIVVKPRIAAGSIGFNIVKDKDHLVELLNNYDNSNGPLLVQEYIKQDGPQYGAELFRDKKGIIKACLVAQIPRWFPLDGGSRVLSVSIHDEKIKKACIDLLNVLDWDGYANVDLVYDCEKNEPKILEINPRTGASIKIDFECGVDLARLILENELGYDVSDMNEYPDGKQISCFLVDFLWLLKCKDRFSAKPSWFDRRKIKDIIFSWDDPLPFITFCIQSAKNYRHAMRQRERRT